MPLPPVPSQSNTTAPPPLKPHEVERERKLELLRKVKSMREGITLNRHAITKGDPTKEYTWVNVKEDRRVFFEQMGWELVKVDPTKPHVVTQWKPQLDGTIIRGDLILYQMDKEMYEAIQAYNVVRGLELTENRGEDFESMLERMQVPVFRPNVK